MSTILKALRRLEQEKMAPVERPLREQVTAAPEPERPRRSWAAPSGALVLGAAIGASLFLLWPAREPERQLAQVQPSRPAPEAPPAAASLATGRPVAASAVPMERAQSAGEPAAPLPVEPRPSLPAQALTSDVEVVRRPDAELRIALEDAAELPGAASPPPPGSVRPQARHLAQSEPDPVPATASAPLPGSRPPQARRPVAPAASEPEAPTPRAVPYADPAPVRAPRQVASAPPRTEPTPPPRPEATASVQASRETPRPAAAAPAQPVAPRASKVSSSTVRVETTRWHPQPDRRQAMVALSKDAEPQPVQEGDRLGGLRIAEIRPAGVLFERDGEQFERRVGVD